MELAAIILILLFIYVYADNYRAKIKRETKRKILFDKLSYEKKKSKVLSEKDEKKKFNYDYFFYQKREYLQSYYWKNIRQQRLKIDNYECVVCVKNKTKNETHKLECHHLTYKRLGAESIKDVRMLCREHHQLQHDTHGYYVKGYHRLIYK